MTDHVLQKFPTSPPSGCGAEERAAWHASQVRLYELALNAIADAVIATLPNGEITFVNPAAEALLGIDRTTALHAQVTSFFTNDAGASVGREVARRLIRDGKIVRLRTFLRHASGRLTPVELTASPLAIDGVPVRIVGTCRDLTLEIQQRRQLEEYARTDPLTRCWNRRWLDEYIAGKLDRAHRDPDGIGVIFIDLDDFGRVNKDYDMEVGDGIITTAVGAMQATIRSSDHLVRYGGDEFLVMVERTTLPGAVRVAEKLLEAIRRLTFTLPNGDPFPLTASMGVAVVRSGDTRLSKLHKDAEKAKERAKRSGKNRICAFSPLEDG